MTIAQTPLTDRVMSVASSSLDSAGAERLASALFRRM
jgi:hypothetical protein